MKRNKILLIIILSLLVIALTTIMIWVIQMGGFRWGIWRSDELKHYLTKEIDSNAVRRLEVDLSRFYDIYIEQNDQDKIKIEAYHTDGKKEMDTIKIETEDGLLKISDSAMKRIGFFIGISRGALKISFPKGLQTEVKEFKVRTSSGDIFWEKGVELKGADLLKLHTVSGDINAGDLQAEQIEIETVSGDVSIQTMEGSYRLKLTSGDVKIGDIKGKGAMETVSGEMQLTFKEIQGDTDIKSTSGDLEILLDHEAKAYIKTKSVSGDIRVDSDSIRSEALLKAETVSGDITIRER